VSVGRLSYPMALLASLLCAACLSPTGPCDSGRSVIGKWRYAGLTQAPVRTTLSGTLLITEESCGEFSGSLAIVELTDQGGTWQRGGPVHGRVIDNGSLRFDAFLEADPRQHLASIKGDSLTGTWVLVDPSGTSISGTFGGRKEAAQ